MQPSNTCFTNTIRGFTYVVLALLVGAVSQGCSDDMGEQTLQVKAAGLWLTANPLDAPPGALAVADTAVIRRPGIVEPRRGQAPDTELPQNVDAMAAFEGNVLAHGATGAIYTRTAENTFTTLTGTFDPPDGHPMRFAEAGGGLYFTTDEGPQRMDTPLTNPTPAGIPPGLEGSGTTTGSSGWLGGGSYASGSVTLGGGAGDVTIVINGTSVGPVAFNTSDTQTATDCATAINASGVASLVTASAMGVVITITADAIGTAGNYTLTASRTAGSATASGATLTGGAAGRTVGYRLVWGARDGDGALMLGAPSGRILVSNTTGGTRDVELSTPIPDGVLIDVHFLQVYRTVIDVEAGEDPGEDMAQVLEVFPTTAQIAAGTLTVTDIASFANGALAYFSPSSGAGIADAKQQPPLLTDAIAFKGYLFGVVEEYAQQIGLTLLAIGGTDGLNTGAGIRITDGSTTENYVADPGSEDPATKLFDLVTGGTAAQQIEGTARSLVRVINGGSALAYAYYVSSPADLPGKIILVSRTVGQAVLSLYALGTGDAWTPRLPSSISSDIERITNVVYVLTGPPHGLQVGETATLVAGNANFAAGDKTVATVVSSTQWTYNETGIDAALSAVTFTTPTPDVEFNQEATPGSWATSAFQEPDAWPPRFRYQVGGPNTTLQRITAQGEALLFWTSDGLYRLTGNDENDFTLRPVDPTINLVGKSTPATMGNKAFALTSQGVVSVTDLGVEKVSTPIDQAILPFYASTDAYREVTDEVAFGVAYSSENEYYLFLPTSDGPAPGDPAVQAYVFNVQTGTWVRHTWEWADINEGTGAIAAAVVNPTDNYLYLGSADWLTRERKSRGLTDYQDTLSAGIPLDVAYVVETAKNPGALKQWTEVACLLESPQPSAVELYFTTEIATVEEGGTISSQGNKAVRTYIPRNMSRSARLTVGLRHSTAQEKPTILGLSVVYNTTSTRVGR